MSKDVKTLTIVEELRLRHTDMEIAYDRFEAEEDSYRREQFKLYYKTTLDIYRDICTEVVEKLLEINPSVLNELKLYGK
jgi:hypothetical protein